jgi:DUF971 family protein
MSAAPWPVSLTYSRGARTLTAAFDTGETVTLPAELLRVESPSAEVQGHGRAGKKRVTGKELVGIARMEPLGNYAVRIVFDDGHATGLYSWRLLHALGRPGQAGDGA